MCCIAEIAMLAFGIITLVKGKFTLSRDRVVTGVPAHIIGILLTVTLPLVMGIGFVIGFTAAMNAPGQQIDVSNYFILDLVIVPTMLLIVLVIALTTSKANSKKPSPSMPGYPPNYPSNQTPMGENPYASPQSDAQNP